MGKPKRQVPIHNLRPNHTSWTPPCLLSFDTETVTTYDGDDEVLTLRLWAARFTDRRTRKRVTAIDESADGLFGTDLAVWMHKLAKQRRVLWAYAHNLGFDLCTTDLIRTMVDFGWTVTEFAISGGAPFMRLRHADATITISDSWSWFGVPLEKVADELGMVKPKLPGNDDSNDVWLERCRADADILHTAMLTLMEWWDNEDLGRWNITGSASGWNAMRHIPSPQEVLIRPDDTECDYDRRAIYGGRRSVWNTGEYRYGHFSEVDIEKAYTTAARFMPLPIGRQCQFTSLPTDHRWLSCHRWGVIAECTITTDQARVPVRIGNSVWYAVGTFRTTLAGPDIRDARARGDLVSVGAGWLHKLGYALRPWATWCIQSQADESGKTPGVAKLVHRQWGRSAIGKWAQRGYEVVDLGPSPNQGWHHEEAWHHGKGVPASIVDFAGNRYQVAAVNQADNAYPAVLAFVESYVRIALCNAVDYCSAARMVACDTDGYIARDIGDSDVESINHVIEPFRVRIKTHYRKIKVIGPQHMELDKTRRRSGIPASAVPGPDGKLHANTWPKLAWQITNGRPGAYIRPATTYKLAATYAPGWVLSDGSVVPVELAIADDGTNAVVPFPQTRYAAAGAQLGPDQNRRLERYRHGSDPTGDRTDNQTVAASR